MRRPVIAIGIGTIGDPEDLLATYADRADLRWIDLATPETIRAASDGAEALIVGLQRVTAAHIEALPDSVRVIGRTGAGYDALDVKAARARGIEVYYEPSYGEAEVATHALGLLLALQRRLMEADRYVRDGWQGPLEVGAVLAPDEMTVGVVGAGRIGKAFIRRLLPIVGEVLVYDPVRADLPAPASRVDDLPSLLTRSHAISLHLPLNAATRGLFGERELAMLPRGALVVNVSRGGIVDEEALARLLVSGHLGGVGCDVFDTEPLAPDSPLLAAPRTILTPHVAAASRRSAWRLSHWTVEDAIVWLSTGSLAHGAPIPEEA